MLPHGWPTLHFSDLGIVRMCRISYHRSHHTNDGLGVPSVSTWALRCGSLAVSLYVSAGSAFLAPPSGSFFATQVSSKSIVSPFAVEYLGQLGSPGPFGLPVFMNCRSAAAIFSDSALGLGPPPVCVSITSAL